jgi:hypothetical protein
MQYAITSYDDKENSPNFKNSETKGEDRIKPYMPIEKTTVASRETLSTNRTKLENQSSSASIKDDDFIKGLDNDIKRTEESLKEMNERFQKIKKQ